MTTPARTVIGGVDCHADTHHAAILDPRGRLIADDQFPATLAGSRRLLAWLRRHGSIERVGVESTGSHGAGLTRYLAEAGITVLEVNRPHAHTRARRGKTDAVDAEAAARKVLAGEATAVPKETGGLVESIRQLRTARAGAVKARAAALVQLRDLLTTAPSILRESITARSLPGKLSQCHKLRPDTLRLDDPVQAAKLALRAIAGRVRLLDAEIAGLDEHLGALVERAAPRTLALLGIGPVHAGQLLVSAGENIERLRSEAAFAHLCGVDPIPASSGKTRRHRLNHGGDRAANSALHMIIVVRLRYCERTRAYLARRTADGLSKRETIRCLKRYLAREVYRTLTDDLNDLHRTT